MIGLLAAYASAVAAIRWFFGGTDRHGDTIGWPASFGLAVPLGFLLWVGWIIIALQLEHGMPDPNLVGCGETIWGDSTCVYQN